MKHSIVRSLLSLSLGVWAFTVISPAIAQGSVKMSGSIIETACTIEMNSRDQTIDMGSFALTRIRRDGQGPVHFFVIRLVNCVFERPNSNKSHWQYIRVTFDGPYKQGVFGVHGQAKGVGLQIQRDEDGEIVVPGQEMSAQTLSQGTRDLVYQLRLVANHDPLIAGQYTSLLRFKLDYE